MFFNFFSGKMLVKTVILSGLALGVFSNCNTRNDKPASKAKTETTSVNLKDRVKKQIENDVRFYIETLNDKRYDELVEVTSTKLFGNKSLKDYKLDLIKQNIAGVSKQINLKKIESISEIVEYKNEYFCIIYCTGDVILNVSRGAEQGIEALKYEFELSYDTPDALIEKNKVIIKDAYFSFIAVSKKGSNFLWKYIEVDKQKEPYYDAVIPAEVLDKL